MAIAGSPFRTICALLFLAALLHRLPFFFAATLDWDESTYLIMGADILEGHLPYVHTWEIKPPLAFLPYAAAAIAGRTVLGVRLLGFVLVAISGCLAYRFARRTFGAGTALWSSLVLVFYLGTTSFFQATLTEHVALPLLLLHLWWLLGPRTWRTLLAAGIALGCACLVRTNLAYLCFGSALALIALSGRRAVREIPLLAAGSIIPVAAVAAVYAAAGEFELLVRSAVEAPLAYATGNSTIGYVMGDMWFGAGLPPYSIVLWTTFLAGAVLIVIRARREPVLLRPTVALALVLAAILSSIVSSGRYFPHYLLQTLPVLAIGAGAAFSRLAETRLRLVAPAILLVFVSASLSQYVKVARGAAAAGTLYYDDTYRVVRYLDEREVAGEYVFFLSEHIGYYLTGARIPSYIVHPSNLIKEPIQKVVHGPEATVPGAVAAVFERRPRFVILKAPFTYVQPGTEERRVFDENLERDYVKAATFGKLQVYERVP